MVGKVKVDTGPVSAEECLANVPREQWRDLVEARGYFCRVKLPHDCRMLLRFVEEAQEMYAELGFESVEDLIRRGLELEPDVVQWAVDGLKSLQPDDEAVPLDTAVQLGQRGAPKGNKNASKEKPGPVENKRTAVPLNRGQSPSYLKARLARDAPDELAKLEAGEHRSVRQAALAAGIVKPPCPLSQLRKWWSKASEDQRAEFLSWTEE